MAYCKIIDAGRMPYGAALELQNNLWQQRVSGEIPDTLVLLEHNHVMTCGISTEDSMFRVPRDEIVRRGIEIHAIRRGGRVTYHGPGQLVGYLIRKLPKMDAKHPKIDVTEHLDKLELLMLNASAEFAKQVYRRDDIDPSTDQRYRGVWYKEGERIFKVGAVGVDASKMVTTHGFALNVCTERLDYFDLIDPCGLKGVEVKTVSQIAGSLVTVNEVKFAIAHKIQDVFGYEEVSSERLETSTKAL